LDLKVLESLGKGQVNKVIYGGAGADITHVLLSTDAKTVYMISYNDYTLDDLRNYIQKDWTLRRMEAAKILCGL